MANEPRKLPSNTPSQGSKQSIIFHVLLAVVMLVLTIGIFRYYTSSKTKVVDLNTSEFISELQGGEYERVEIQAVSGDGNQGIFKFIAYDDDNKDKIYQAIIYDLHYDELIEYMNTNNIEYNTIKAAQQSIWMTMAMTFLPILLIAVLIFVGYRMMTKSMAKENSKAMDFGKSRANLNRGKTTTFNDIAGYEEEKVELEELVDFLKNPSKYREIGARIPKGVLLSGPPGTGKTLFARGVAGEAEVPFFTISGSDFVEMFVGVGASRVRDMFKTAKQNSPCIVFIDEIDAVGRQRGAGLGGGNDEREQTLNQLLTEMDGFATNSGIIVMAATNRPDVLDPALLRPGRFDRQITIDIPDVKGREEILKVHSRNKKLAEEVNLAIIARRTPGFSGADIENLMNESALLVARDSRKKIRMTDIDEAVDRVMVGPAKKSRVISEQERNVVSHHEAGHAVVGLKLNDASVVHRVTIIPRGKTGGFAMILPEKEKFNYTKSELIEQIVGLLGGRVAEEIVFGEITTGAHNDIERATKLARAMVTEYGMSKLGPIQYEQNTGSVFLGRDYNKKQNFSGTVANQIDDEVRSIIDECYEKAKEVIIENRDLLDTIAKYLLEIETLTKEDIEEIDKTGTLKWWEKEKIRKKLDVPTADNKESKEETKTDEDISEEQEISEEVETKDTEQLIDNDDSELTDDESTVDKINELLNNDDE